MKLKDFENTEKFTEIKQNNYLGLLYPIYNFENELVGYKKITTAYSCENKACLIVGISGNYPSLVLSYPEIGALSKSKEESDKKNNRLNSETEIFENIDHTTPPDSGCNLFSFENIKSKRINQ